MSSQAISFRQTWNDRVDLAPNGTSYKFGNLPKPCVYPLMTPKGHQIGGFQMSDHPWHRGLWFTIKLINGSNFWEENEPFGTQDTHTQPTCELLGPATLRISHALEWRSEATGPVIAERRTVVFRPGPDGTQFIDWSTSLEPLQKLTLD